MAISERDLEQAEARMDVARGEGHAVSARYDRRRARIVVALSTGLELTFPARMAQGLAGASADDLAEIEISGAGLGLHWPKLDADLYIPALNAGHVRIESMDGPRTRRFGWPRPVASQDRSVAPKRSKGRATAQIRVCLI